MIRTPFPSENILEVMEEENEIIPNIICDAMMIILKIKETTC